MATLRTVTVNTDNEGSPDYTYLEDAMSTEVGDISPTGSDEYVVFECTGATDDTTYVSITGWTQNNSANYIKVVTPEADRHQGSWDGSKYALVIADDGAIDIAEDYVYIEALQISFEVEQYNVNAGIECSELSTSTSVRYIDKCIIKGNGGQNYDYAAGISHWDELTANTTVVIRNNIIYDINPDSTETYVSGILLGGGTEAEYNYVYNNTIHSCAYGIYNQSQSNLYLRNNIINDIVTLAFDNSGGVMQTAGYNNFDDSTTVGNLIIDDEMGSTLKTGTTTSAGTNKLYDSGGGLSVAAVGSIVKDSGTNWAHVTVVNSDTELTLSADIFSDSESYTIYSSMYGDVTFENEGSDIFKLGSTDALARDRGEDLSAVTYGFEDDILSNARPY